MREIKFTEIVKTLQSLLLDPKGNPSIIGLDEDNRLIGEALATLSDIKTKPVYVAWTNTDSTEGRGTSRPLVVCDYSVTAYRLGAGKYVQGTDCPVYEDVAFCLNGQWYSAVYIDSGTEEDVNKTKQKSEQELAENKALELGLTPKEVMAIKGETQ